MDQLQIQLRKMDCTIDLIQTNNQFITHSTPISDTRIFTFITQTYDFICIDDYIALEEIHKQVLLVLPDLQSTNLFHHGEFKLRLCNWKYKNITLSFCYY